MANKKINLPELEVKERIYILIKDTTPISYQLRSKHTRYNPLLFFDGNTQRALRYCSNQTSIFQDRQDDNALLEHIIFEDGKLNVKAEETLLQQFLEVHPDNGTVFIEFDPEQDAQAEYEELVSALDAQAVARDMDITDLEAIGRVIYRSKVDKMTSSELKRDLLMYAKSNPKKFLELSNDSSIKLRNLAVRAVDSGILGLKDDNRTVYWVDSDEVLITINFGENAYSAIASYFKTDEGIDAMNTIILKLS